MDYNPQDNQRGIVTFTVFLMLLFFAIMKIISIFI